MDHSPPDAEVLRDVLARQLDDEARDSDDDPECQVAVASLEDVIRSKQAAARPKDHRTLPVLQALLKEIRRRHGPS